jgi:hypothetical protein
MRYAHDLFVSYAVRDDTPKPAGWVTAFVNHLENYLLHQLGRRDLNIWMDRRQLDGNDLLTPEIIAAVRSAAVFLMFHSPQYQASEWCQQEFRTFCERVADPTRVFLIELTNNVKRPAPLEDLRGYRFWAYENDGRTPRRLAYPDFDAERDREYHVLLNTLGNQMASNIQRLQDSAGMPSSPSVERSAERFTATPAGTFPALPAATSAATPSGPSTEFWPELPQTLAELLPGGWRMQIVYPNGLMGHAVLHVYANGAFHGEGMSPIGPFRVDGSWALMPPTQVILRGRQFVGGFPAPDYLGVIRFWQIRPNELTGAMNTGERISWQRVV